MSGILNLCKITKQNKKAQILLISEVSLKFALAKWLDKANLFNNFIETEFLTFKVSYSKSWATTVTAQKMKFSITDFFSKFDQIRRNCGFGHIYWRFGHIYWRNP